ncbi:MAG: hypothetical protein KAT00_00385 [Planctomycetes bacterium]|nr:hypothetical protein [Planctomycetota bacterium]
MDEVELKIIDVPKGSIDVFAMPCCPLCDQPVEYGDSRACMIRLATDHGPAIALGHAGCANDAA